MLTHRPTGTTGRTATTATNTTIIARRVRGGAVTVGQASSTWWRFHFWRPRLGRCGLGMGRSWPRLGDVAEGWAMVALECPPGHREQGSDQPPPWAKARSNWSAGISSALQGMVNAKSRSPYSRAAAFWLARHAAGETGRHRPPRTSRAIDDLHRLRIAIWTLRCIRQRLVGSDRPPEPDRCRRCPPCPRSPAVRDRSRQPHVRSRPPDLPGAVLHGPARSGFRRGRSAEDGT